MCLSFANAPNRQIEGTERYYALWMAQKVPPDDSRKQLSSDGIQAALFKPEEAAIATAQACAEAQAPAGVWTSALDLHE